VVGVAAGGSVAIVVGGGGLVAGVVVGGTVDGGVLSGAVVVVVGLGFGTVVVVGGTGSVVVVGGFLCAGLVVEVVVGALVVVVEVGGAWCRPGCVVDVVSGGPVCLFGCEGWGTVVAGPCPEGRVTGFADRDGCDELLDASDIRVAVSVLTTGTPAPVVRLGISGRVAPT
jgi:hypothetical protein